MRADWNRWQNSLSLTSKEYLCGFCSHRVGSHIGYFNDHSPAKIYICTNCGIPTLFYGNEQYPGPILGRHINNLPTDVEQIYKEIRDSIKNASYTGALLLGRKLIMHLAVSVAGAKEGETFTAYVEHLKKSGYIPPSGDKILKYIKDLGNEKNHELKIGVKEENEKMLKFIEGLLIFIYEFPAEFEEVPKQI
jgi:hypothetical protein